MLAHPTTEGLATPLCTDIQCKESLHYCHFCIVHRHPMSGKCTLLSLLYCSMTSNVRKVYIAITFILCKDIQCQESLHCYHFCIVRRHPMAGKSTLLSLLYCAKTSNGRKGYIVITFVLCEDIQQQESLHCYHYHFCIVRRNPMAEVFIAMITSVLCEDVQCQESLHCYQVLYCAEDIQWQESLH